MNEIEQAIYFLNTLQGVGAYQQIIGTALAALREQAERGKGCEYCQRSLFSTRSNLEVEFESCLDKINFCPMCGKHLEVEK